jgi:hypothetical protein
MIDIQDQLIRLDKVLKAEVKRLASDDQVMRDKLDMLAVVAMLSAKTLLEEVADYTKVKLDKIKEE